MSSFLYKKSSSINGSGIFTKRVILKGEKFYKVPIALLSNTSKPKRAFIGNDTRVSDLLILDNINHSCSSNTVLDISKSPLLIAKRVINVGEEITVDYNQTEVNGEKVICACGSKQCQGFFLRIE